MIAFKAGSGALVFRSTFAFEGGSRAEAAPACPTCHQPISVRREPMTGHTLESCRCGTRPIRRVLSTQWVGPVAVNPFTDAELEKGNATRLKPCVACRVPTPVRKTRVGGLCIACAKAKREARWSPEVRAALCADYAVMDIHTIRVKYKADYSTLREILVAEGVALRACGEGLSKYALRNTATATLRDQLAEMPVPDLAAHYGVQEKYLRRELHTRRLKIPRKTRPPTGATP